MWITLLDWGLPNRYNWSISRWFAIAAASGRSGSSSGFMPQNTFKLLIHGHRHIVKGLEQAIARNRSQYVYARHLEARLGRCSNRFSVTGSRCRGGENHGAWTAILNPTDRQSLRPAFPFIRSPLGTGFRTAIVLGSGRQTDITRKTDGLGTAPRDDGRFVLRITASTGIFH